jgi:spermidine/putrescine transport system ATP-binding protein
VNAFVANFIGMNNLVAGQVLESGSGYIEIASPLGAFKVPTAHPLPMGAAASFVVAGDRISLAAEGTPMNPGLPHIDGTVLGLEFVGSTQTVFVDVAGASEFRVQKQQHEIESLGLVPGRRVSLSWDPRHAWLLPQAT